MMTKEGYTKLGNFITPRVEVVALGCGHIGYIVKMLNFIRKSTLLLSIGHTNLLEAMNLMTEKECDPGERKGMLLIGENEGIFILGYLILNINR